MRVDRRRRDIHTDLPRVQASPEKEIEDLKLRVRNLERLIGERTLEIALLKELLGEDQDDGRRRVRRISMTPEIMRQYLAAHAPELEVVELPEAHTTEYIAREWKVQPAQVAKTLTMRIGKDAIIVVTCGDSRLDNRKVKEELGGKGQMMPGSEASEITGHSVGAITPLCLGSFLPVFFDVGLKRFEEVVTAGGSTHAAIRIPLTRFAQLTGAKWVDVCKEM